MFGIQKYVSRMVKFSPGFWVAGMVRFSRYLFPLWAVNTISKNKVKT